MSKPNIGSDFCKQVLGFDDNIRYVGLVDRSLKVIQSEQKKGHVPLLSREESLLSVQQSVIRMGSRKTLQSKLGKLVYSSSYFEKVKRATVPLSNDMVLLLSFEADSDYDRIIMEKIIPFAGKLGLLGD
jgi:hypothetical protein